MKLNIGYFADGKWSHAAFNKIIKDPDIRLSFICVRYNSNNIILKNYAKKYKIKFLKYKDVNSDEFIKVIQKYNCDLFVSMSFDQIFKNKIINIPKYKIINCHAGKLPFYRGRNILNWVLINDEKEFGITVHYIDKGIDTGDIILQKIYKISDKDNYKTLLERSYIKCAEILYEAILMFKKGKPKSQKQSDIHPLGFYCQKRVKGDEFLNWSQTSRDIFNFVRAICKPGPMARAFLKKKEMKINKVKLIKRVLQYRRIPGVIIGKGKNFLEVTTKDTLIKITDYEYDGNIKIGDRFEIK